MNFYKLGTIASCIVSIANLLMLLAHLYGDLGDMTLSERELKKMIICGDNE